MTTTTDPTIETGDGDDGDDGEDLSFMFVPDGSGMKNSDLLDTGNEVKGEKIVEGEVNGNDDIDVILEVLVREAREVIDNDFQPDPQDIMIVEMPKIIEKPVTKAGEITSIESLSVVDPKITSVLGGTPQNYILETYLLGMFDGFLKAIDVDRFPIDLMNQLRKLKDISMRKDKIAAVQTWDVIVYAMQKIDPPSNMIEVFADVEAFLRIFKKLFFTDLNLY